MELATNNSNEINLQLSTISTMCTYGNQDCINKARAYYNDWFDNDKPIPPNFKNTVFRTFIRYGNEDDWFNLYRRAIKTDDNSERLRMFRGLASSRDYNLLKYLIVKSADDSIIKSQDETTIVSLIAANSVGRKLAFDYFLENWDRFYRLYGFVSFTLPNLVDTVTSGLKTKYDLKTLLDFIENTPELGIAESAFEIAIENINTNIQWVEKNQESVKSWLVQHVSSLTTKATAPATTTTPATTILSTSTSKPTLPATEAPTNPQTNAPTNAPTEAPTNAPTEAPTQAPTEAPTNAPTEAPTQAPTEAPTEVPTEAPTEAPTNLPTESTSSP
jgi:hypothetical protein